MSKAPNLRFFDLTFFSLECYSIPDSSDINLTKIGENFLANLEQSLKEDSRILLPLPSFDFLDASDTNNNELIALETSRAQTSEKAEKIGKIYTDNPPNEAPWITNKDYCDQNPCVYISTGQEKTQKLQIDVFESDCNSNLLKFGDKKYRNEYIEVECKDKNTETECYRKPCNCDLQISDATLQPISIQPTGAWNCFPPNDPILTTQTMFLSPSPMNYTFAKCSDKACIDQETDLLETSFTETFVSSLKFYRKNFSHPLFSETKYNYSFKW